MDQEEMAKDLDWTPEQVQKRREEVRWEKSLLSPAEFLQSGLLGLADYPHQLDTEVVEICDAYSPYSNEHQAGGDALLVELYSDDPQQQALASRIRLGFRDALLQNDFCIIINHMLPLIAQITQGIQPTTARFIPTTQDASTTS